MKCQLVPVLLAALLVFAPAVGALKLQSLGITVNLDSAGNARIAESYQLGFIGPFEFSEFRAKARQNSSSLSSWEADYNFFYPHFERAGGGIQKSTITFNEGSKSLSLDYTLNKAFARLETSEQRSDLYVIDSQQFQQFNVGGAVIIPDNVTITFVLPPDSELNIGSLPAKAVVQNNKVMLTGLQSNSVTVGYRVFKPIAPSSDDFVYGIANVYVLLPLALIVLGLVYLKREEVEERIENYLVEHSDLKGSQKHEEDFELKLE